MLPTKITAEEVSDYFDSHPGTSCKAAAAHFGVSVTLVRRKLRQANVADPPRIFRKTRELLEKVHAVETRYPISRHEAFVQVTGKRNNYSYYLSHMNELYGPPLRSHTRSARRGAPPSEFQHRRKATLEKMQALDKAGVPRSDIARKFDYHPATVTRLLGLKKEVTMSPIKAIPLDEVDEESTGQSHTDHPPCADG